MCIYTCICKYTRMHTNVCICTYTCLYIHICMYMCTQAHQQGAAAAYHTAFPVEIRQHICTIYTRTSIHVLMCFLFWKFI